MAAKDRAAKGAAKEEAVEGEANPYDVPAGGLHAPKAKPLPEGQAERFPGEALLSEEERNRHLVLHFALPRTLVTRDVAEGRTTEDELNEILSEMCWGSISVTESEWVLESEDPTMGPPDPALISYADFTRRTFPEDPNMQREERENNLKLAANKRRTFTQHGEPGAKLKPIFDQMVKCLQHTNKNLAKFYDLKRVVLDEAEEPENPEKDEAQNIMRFGRHTVLPSFWQLLMHLVKARRRFSIIFHAFGDEQEDLRLVQRQLNLFCEGKHPAYSGQMKTPKAPPMNGDKNSQSYVLKEEHWGIMDRFSGRLEFARRPEQGLKQPEETKPAEPAEPAEVEGEETKSAEPAEPADCEFKPTVYEFPPATDSNRFVYAGMMKQILEETNTVAIVDDRDYWVAKQHESTAGKLLLVDHAGGFALVDNAQHIFFDGHIAADGLGRVDVRDLVSGEPLSLQTVNELFVHRVNFFSAIVDPEYYIKAVEACDMSLSKAILDSRKFPGLKHGDLPHSAEDLNDLTPKQYLYKTVIPALMPALEACQRDRPSDPMEFIAFYLLRHPHQYSKSLKA